MPTYQYRCTGCGHDLEAVQKFSDAALTECPSCGGQLRKVYNAVGVVFKGSGFYRTDSRKAPSESGTADAGAGSGSAKGAGDTAGAGKSNGSGSGGTTAKESSGAGSSSSPSSGSSTAAKPAKAAGS